jgi:hypothetical protein
MVREAKRQKYVDDFSRKEASGRERETPKRERAHPCLKGVRERE